MSIDVPAHMKAIVIADKKPVLCDVAVPTLQANEVLVQVAYVALNPTDWKHAKNIGAEGAICGCDYAGMVVKLGPGLKNTGWKVGDRIAGMTHGGKFTDRGAFAEYLKVESDLALKVPGTMSLKAASSFGIPYATAMQVFHRSQGHPMYPARLDKAAWYLVYGGSTSVGLFAVQIAKAAGYKVVATASEKNFSLVKEYGADQVVDYTDSAACATSIKELTQDSISIGLDCISTESSVRICLAAFGSASSVHKQLNVLLPQPETTKDLSQTLGIKVESTLAYTLMGKSFQFSPGTHEYPAVSEDRAFYAHLSRVTPDQLVNGPKWRPNPLTEGMGLIGVLDGLHKLEHGQVRASKLVYNFDEGAVSM